ncbi:MAG TPA: ATP phosphoribosyltransferase [Bacillota bacterium]
MLKVAIPNKGQLAEPALLLLQEAGYTCKPGGRELITCDSKNGINFYFIRPRDIATYVGRGIIDLGITGRDLLSDSEVSVVELLALGFAKSKFYYAVARESGITVDNLAGQRIATSYPGIVAKDLARKGVTAKIVRLDGAVEIAIRLGVADVIADVVQSGRTLEQAGLVKIGTPLLESEGVLAARCQEAAANPEVQAFIQRINGILLARQYVMVEYDIPGAALEVACRITPGIESPTIAPLSKKDWFAVKAMVKTEELYQVIESLKAGGARGIIVTELKTCRL